jgi:hypothetical protein
MLSVTIKPIKLNVTMLSSIMPSVIVLNVVAPAMVLSNKTPLLPTGVTKPVRSRFVSSASLNQKGGRGKEFPPPPSFSHFHFFQGLLSFPKKRKFSKFLI